MRRKDRADDGGVPARLAYFTPADWPGNRFEQFEAWRQARLRWVAEGHPIPAGDPASMIRQHVAVRRRLSGLPLPVGMAAGGSGIPDPGDRPGSRPSMRQEGSSHAI